MKRSPSRIKLVAAAASLVRASGRPGAPTISQRAQAVPRLIRATLDGSYAGTSAKRLGLVAAAVAYVVSPIDLVPELVVPVLGVADDAVVLGWAVKAFVEETDRFLSWELEQGLRPEGRTVRGETIIVDPSRDVTGAADPNRRVPRSSPVRGAATDHLLEAVRRRLER